MNKYEIKPYKKVDEDKKGKLIPDHLPHHPFRWLIIAPSYSGKSVMVSNLLSNSNFGYKNYFSHLEKIKVENTKDILKDEEQEEKETIKRVSDIFIICPTFYSDYDVWQPCNLDEENIFTEYNDEIIQSLIELQQERIDNLGRKKAPKILLILDDCVLEQGKNNKTIEHIFFKGRHYNINTIICSQNFYSLAPSIRLNCSHICVFKVNPMELEKLALNENIDPSIYKKYYEIATNDKYSFLYLDRKNKKYFKNFIKILSHKFI